MGGVKVDSKQKQELFDFLDNYKDVFAHDLTQIGKTPIMAYDIEVDPNIRPFRLAQYKCPYKHREIIENEVKKLLEADLIERATDCRWGNPLVLVSKGNSKDMRICEDLRKLNSMTTLQPYPMLNLDCFYCDVGKKVCNWYSVIDLRSAYRQVELSKRSQKMCTFTCHLGDFVPKRCVFGLKNMSYVFQRLMDIVLEGIKNKFVACYQDDVICFSSTYAEHLLHLREIFNRLRNANLKVQPDKTKLCQNKVTFLGFQISAKGVETDGKNIAKVKNFPVPKKKKDVQAILGLSNFYRKHILGYSKICIPLYKLTEKSDKAFECSNECQIAFDTLKEKLINAPLLALPQLNSDEIMILTVDTSAEAIGYVLSQYQTDPETNKRIERVLYYGGKNLKSVESKYGSTHLEILGAAYAVQKLDTYLRGRRFRLVTDHKSILYIIIKKTG